MAIMLENLPRTIALRKEGGAPQAVVLDQRLLPSSVAYLEIADWRTMVDAIKTLAVRGAPAIGVAGAAAVVLAAHEAAVEQGDDQQAALRALKEAAQAIEQARPTAVNLSVGVRRMMDAAIEIDLAQDGMKGLVDRLYDAACDMAIKDEQANRAMGKQGARYLRSLGFSEQRPVTLLTHCNAGSLATAYYGTALGVVYAAAEEGLVKHVYADETRPVNQGARLSVWELSRAGVPVTLNCDNMAASLMAQGRIDAVIVGADRIAANGDTANKIGTLGVAVLARYFDIPFVVAAPRSTIDLTTPSGEDIVIEQRSAREVLPEPIEGVEVYNPAFDVTPAHLISALVCEDGVYDPSELHRVICPKP